MLAAILSVLSVLPAPRAEPSSPSGPMKLVLHEGKPHVSASDLAREGMAVKSLPGQDQLVACREDLCVLVRDYHVRNGETFVAIDALAEALGGQAVFDDARTTARLDFSTVPAPAREGTVQVGQLAPDFRLTRLDGTSIALSDLRGRRVLINSWASW